MPQQKIKQGTKASFYEEAECVFDKFPTYRMKMLLYFSAKVSREDTSKPTFGNESLHEISNDNKVRAVNCTVKSTMFPHHSIHKFTWTSPDGKTQNQIENILVVSKWYSNVLSVRLFRAADCDTDHYLVVAKVRERLAVSKQTMHRFHTERLKCIINRAWDTTRENIKMSAKERLGYYELKKHKPWFDKGS
jgi:hypothetical protein